jgi:metacaspase-1
MTGAVAEARAGDTVVITYSGHGTYVADQNGDETDAADECLCPADCFAGNLITDDELATIFQDRHRGVRLVFVSDSCHSGTVSRFAMMEAPAGPVAKVRFLPPEHLNLPVALRPFFRGFDPRGTSPLKSSALLLSGCMDWEYSYDAWYGDRANGAMTRNAIDSLNELPGGATYKDWFKALRQRIPSQQYPQSPNLYGTSEQKRWKAFA